jgi:hypothetical protein
MKGKIDKNGWLTIERSGTERPQLCPVAAYNPDIDFSRCGDWCPLFGEPIYLDMNITALEICRTRLVFDEFTDERSPQ